MATEKRLDLIDRGALGIGRANPLVFEKAEYAHGWNSAIDIIQKAPTVDAVEVVRCKDCKHYHADTLSCDFTPHGKYYERPNWYEDDFCSYGERKAE